MALLATAKMLFSPEEPVACLKVIIVATDNHQWCGAPEHLSLLHAVDTTG
jgi:hypothetical protein